MHFFLYIKINAKFTQIKCALSSPGLRATFKYVNNMHTFPFNISGTCAHARQWHSSLLERTSEAVRIWRFDGEMSLFLINLGLWSVLFFFKFTFKNEVKQYIKTIENLRALYHIFLLSKL